MTQHGPIRCVQNVHIKELIGRIGWVIRLRLFFMLASLAAAAIGLAGYLGAEGNGWIMLGVALFLGLSNGYYRWVLTRSNRVCVGIPELRRYCLVQICGDYIALGFVVYALGTIETPIMFMVLPNIIVAALFYTRRQSLLIAVAGIIIVLLPLWLELLGGLPVNVIFDADHKLNLLSSPVLLRGYLLLFITCVLLCWYLVSAITESLITTELELEDNYRSMLLLDEEKTKGTLRGTHELKAPLAAIISYVYTLREGYAGPLPEKAATIIERIGVRCERLMEKVTDIIRLGNLRSYVVTGSQFVDIPLGQALKRVCDELAPLAEGRQQRLILRCDEGAGPYRVRATDEHLDTLFTNLVANALNYSHDGGEVQVTLSRATTGGFVVEVSDNGIGIAADQLATIFDEHYRAKNAVAHHEHGTGLGLPIVKTLARLLDAELGVESEVGVGTRFRITFNPSGRGAS